MFLQILLQFKVAVGRQRLKFIPAHKNSRSKEEGHSTHNGHGFSPFEGTQSNAPLGEYCSSKPQSISKRRFRFGPWSRRLHKNTPRQGTSSAASSALTPPVLIQSRPSKTTLPQQGLHSLNSNESSIQKDIVTFQPAIFFRKSPFGNYKVSDSVADPMFNPSKRAAKCLGISKTKFEEKLTTEINELLQEIEFTRREALGTKPSIENSNSQGEQCRKSDNNLLPQEDAPAGTQLESKLTDGDLRTSLSDTFQHVSYEPETPTPLPSHSEKPKSRPQNEMFFRT